jgi:hypothetical protein
VARGKQVARDLREKETPSGTTFSFSLNEPASVSFTFTQRVSGRKIGQHCLAKRAKGRKGKSCNLTVTAGTLSFTGHIGPNKVVLQGVLSRSQRLMPGRYTLMITARNAAGSSKAGPLSFTIVR